MLSNEKLMGHDGVLYANNRFSFLKIIYKLPLVAALLINWGFENGMALN